MLNFVPTIAFRDEDAIIITERAEEFALSKGPGLIGIMQRNFLYSLVQLHIKQTKMKTQSGNLTFSSWQEPIVWNVQLPNILVTAFS